MWDTNVFYWDAEKMIIYYTKYLLFFLILLMFSKAVQAEVMRASSLECLACQADLVITGEVVNLVSNDRNPSVPELKLTIEVDQVFKGDLPAKTIQVAFIVNTGLDKQKAIGRLNNRHLLFLSKSQKQYFPTSTQLPVSVFNLSSISGHIYSKDMRILSDSQEILSLTRKWVNSKIEHCVSREKINNTLIFNRLYAGSACFLDVPAEESWRMHFVKMAQSSQWHQREKAAAELYKFPGPETERILRNLLKDNSENMATSSGDTIESFQYSVRRAAYYSLIALKVPVL
jgi:hypothetical protein